MEGSSDRRCKALLTYGVGITYPAGNRTQAALVGGWRTNHQPTTALCDTNSCTLHLHTNCYMAWLCNNCHVSLARLTDKHESLNTNNMHASNFLTDIIVKSPCYLLYVLATYLHSNTYMWCLQLPITCNICSGFIGTSKLPIILDNTYYYFVFFWEAVISV